MSDLMKQAEPVAWYRYERFGEWRQIPASEWNFDWASMMVKQGWTEIPLYAALPTEAAIRADEREKCLKIAQAHRCTGMDGDFYKGINSACDAISKTIRRRGEG